MVIIWIFLGIFQVLARQYSISGFSSGGFFAHQLHIVHSSNIVGVGIVAGGPYYCTMGSFNRFMSACSCNSFLVSIETSLSLATTLAQDKRIDTLNTLGQAKVYIFSGSGDTVVYPSLVKITEQVYRNLGNSSNIYTKYDLNAQHSWVTLNEGNPCWYLGWPGVNNCNFDLAGAIFNYIYPNLNSRGTQLKSNLYEFDQSVYTDVWKAGMSNRGFIYIPNSCMSNVCLVHVMFHGCLGSFEINGYTFMYEIGVNDWAESNNIVVIYPQITAHSNNTDGCWDFWGYTGDNFYDYSAPQIAAVHAMAQNPPVVNWSS